MGLGVGMYMPRFVRWVGLFPEVGTLLYLVHGLRYMLYRDNHTGSPPSPAHNPITQ